MIKDPIVEEIRKYRKLHAQKHNNDLKKIVADLKKKEQSSDREIVHFGPKLLVKKTG